MNHFVLALLISIFFALHSAVWYITVWSEAGCILVTEPRRELHQAVARGIRLSSELVRYSTTYTLTFAYCTEASSSSRTSKPKSRVARLIG